MSKNTISISQGQVGRNALTFFRRSKNVLIMTLKLRKLTKMKIQTLKFLVVFFSLGWSIYMGSFLVEAFQEINQKNLQTFQSLKK